MPQRKTPLITDEIYHVFNRGIDKIPTYRDKREYQRFVTTITFYRYQNPPVKLSRFLALPWLDQQNILTKLEANNKSVNVLCYCLMPNHFHLLLKQNINHGISNFLGYIQNSYTKYFNTKHDRIGGLFLDQFKAVRVEKDEQLLHVSRYIHLNPHTGYVINNIDNLPTYQWSSLKEYINSTSNQICNTEIILAIFRNREAYRNFIYDQADYQRTLKQNEHLLLE